jgi:integrase/recombinase XerD
MRRPKHAYLQESAGDSLVCIRTAIDQYVQRRRGLGEFSKGTAKNAKAVLHALADAAGPTKAIGRLSRADIETWLENMRCAASTKYSRLCYVRAFTADCHARDMIRTDPAANIRGARRPRTLPRSIENGSVGNILAFCDERLRVCVSLAVQEGLRRAEIAGLSTSDIDLENRLVRVYGKGDKERIVPLSDETRIAIGLYLAVHPAGPHRPLVRSYHTDQALVPDTVGIAVSRAMRAAGVKHAAWDGKSAHALRHTCANDMLDHGADVRDVQEMLGHANLATTSIYTRRQAALGRLRDAASGRSYS